MQQNLTFLSARTRATALAAALACAALLAPMPAAVQAQGLFAPAVIVNEDVITEYELRQRALFLSLVGNEANAEAQAREDLIEDRLKRAALKEAGIALSEAEITEGMTELAERANMTLDQFLGQLAQAGVDAETLRDFSSVGLGWRQYVQGRYLSRARPTEEEIDRAMGTAGSGGLQVLLSEIILPLDPSNAVQVQDLATQISELTTTEAFAASAVQFSAANSRFDGGRLDWMALSRLPAPLQQVVLALEPGEITQPLPLQGAVALFQMRGLRETAAKDPTYAAIDYATYAIPGGLSAQGQSAAAKLRADIDTCDDLYGVNKGKDPQILQRQSVAPADIPRDIALELAKLDPNESSATVTRNDGQTLLLVMLCGRTAEINASGEEARINVANALAQQRLTALAESYLQQLKANARIEIR